MQCGNSFGVSDMRRIGVDAIEHRPPQGWLPGEIGVDVTGVVVLPVDEQLRPLPRVGGEEPGQASRDGVAAPHAELTLLTGFEVAEVGGQWLAPIVVAAGVDDF